ncbi:MAG: LysE family translocator [Anaerolineae bacterium]
MNPSDGDLCSCLDAAAFSVFAAAVVLAVTPGPGIFYVLARSIKGGRREGYASAAGTAVGGLFHVVAAALGVSALLAASAEAFTVVKYAGAAYLIYLGIRALMQPDAAPSWMAASAAKPAAPSIRASPPRCWILDGAVLPRLHPAVRQSARRSCWSSSCSAASACS